MTTTVSHVIPLRSRLSIGGLLSVLAIAPIAACAQNTIIFDAPGADTNPGDFNGTYPAAINARGAITGSFQDANSTYHGFLRNPNGTIVTFDAPGAGTGPYLGTSPSSMNDFGEITGNYLDVNGYSHGFVRTPEGRFLSLDVPGAGGFGSTPKAVNLEGAIVGFYTDSNYAFRAFLRRPDGTFVTWVDPGECTGNGSSGCYGSGATNIDLVGIIAAGYNDSNFVHHGLVRTQNGRLIPYDVPGAQSTGCPGCDSGLNQWGAIAGIYADANYVNHGFLRDPKGRFTTFDAPGAGTGSYQGTGCPSDCPVSVNNVGAVTGMYIDTNFVYHSYLRTPEGKIITIDPEGSYFTFSSGINDGGVVAGYYLDADNVIHGFLRIPENLERSDWLQVP
ncbi:hypothetical protein DYQ86_15605 [Acidobacteria bacterium AB60]|nr:hypothetical protein DYQ86_15605 [Acidobacteria bacterium AB60]